MSAFSNFNLFCTKKFYQLNKKNWFVEKDGKKIPNRHWKEFFCVLHYKTHIDDWKKL